MVGINQEGFAKLLEAVWAYAQEIRERTGLVVELRLTTLGLTAFAADRACSRAASVSWAELAVSHDLPRLLSDMMKQAAERPKVQASPVSTFRRLMAA